MSDSVGQAQSIVGYSDRRAVLDFYPTPPEATRALLSVEKFDQCVWECACGDGAISKVLWNAGYIVRSSDIKDYGYPGTKIINFLEWLTPSAEAIVTNPPFLLAEKFIDHAHTIGFSKMALFLKLAFLEE